jgi:hypothetical protein
MKHSLLELEELLMILILFFMTSFLVALKPTFVLLGFAYGSFCFCVQDFYGGIYIF